MTVLDSYAVLAYLREEAAADEVGVLLSEGDVAMTALGVAEVIDHLVRRFELDEEQAALDLAQLGLLDALSVDEIVGMAAGRLRASRYDRTRCALSLADCVAAEVARLTYRPLATSDPALLDACHAEGIAVVVLPGTDGSRWRS